MLTYTERPFNTTEWIIPFNTNVVAIVSGTCFVTISGLLGGLYEDKAWISVTIWKHHLYVLNVNNITAKL